MRPRARTVLVCAAYVLLAVATTWPLARHLRTDLTGDVNGDTGVYVWNLWIFRHEILEHGRLPFSTDHVLAYTDGTDFALHNYTPFVGAIAAPLIGLLGLIATFNLVLLAIIAAAALGTYALARQHGLSPPYAWLAGALFAASPAIVARETAHFSLVAAAPLPIFLWALVRTLETGRWRDGALVGAIVAWATYSDAYYGIYCTLMGLVLLAWRGLVVQTRPGARSRMTPVITRTLDGLLIGLACVVVWRLANGSGGVSLAGIRIRALYTPMLALTILALARLWLVWRPAVRMARPGLDLRTLWKPGVVALVACNCLMLPMFVGLVRRAMHGQLPATPVFWRSSPRGVDLLAYLVPNPSHPLFGPHVATWFMPDKPDAFPEYVASFSIVALALIAIAAWRRALPGFWVAFTAVFMALSLGPFVYVAGVDTYVPGPWAFLRYAPAIEMARAPSRFAIVAGLGLSMLTACALRDLLQRTSRHRQVLAAGIAVALAAEVIPAPRHLYSADVPEVYRIISRATDESGRVLELPTGVRDGTSSLGDFGPASQYFQTGHHHPLLGGYLSRVSPSRREAALRLPVFGALIRLSERQPLSDEMRTRAVTARDQFLRRTCVGYVVVDRRRATPELAAFAESTLQLERIHEDDDYLLFVPRDAPPCERPPARTRRRHGVDDDR